MLKKEIPDQRVERANLKSLRELVEYGKSEYSDRLAFRYREGKGIAEVTFGKFYDDVEAFGEYIIAQGLTDGDRVAVVGENSYAWITTYFATVNGGNVIVPIDKELKPNEIAPLIDNSESKLVFYSKAKTDCIEEIKSIGVSTDRFICLDEFENLVKQGREIIEKGEGKYQSVTLDIEKLCAIIYTSGTTGDPKGVMLSHKNLARDAYLSMSCMYIYDATIAVLPLNHTFGFMASVICPLWMGHTIFINNSLKTVLKDIQAAQPWYISVVPLFLETFYKNIWKAIDKQGKTKLVKTLIKVSNGLRKVGIDLRRVFFKSIIDNFGGKLGMIITGGAPISDEYMQGFEDLGILVINGYGITECSPIVALNRNNNVRYGTVGNPIPEVEIKIENPDADNEGEIWVKGDIVMMGYYKKPEETARVLKDGWFNTEDIGKLEGKFLSITGRKKNIIILENGKNVYPEELENLISFIENVDEVVVHGNQGMIVAEIYSSAEEDVENIRKQIEAEVWEINKTLASYKQIKKVVFRETEFQKTATRKIKRDLIK